MNDEVTPNFESTSDGAVESHEARNIAGFWQRILALLIDTIALGLVGVILGFLLFNRKTRQSLHDLIARTYVVRASTASAPSPLAAWKGHPYIAGSWLLLSFLVAFVLAPLATSGGAFANLMKLQRAVMDSGKVHIASVFIGLSAGPNGNVNYVRTDAVWKNEPTSFEQAERDIASIVLKEYPDAAGKDLIVVTIAYGYDIGISSAWRSDTRQATPEEWMSRIQSSSAR